MVNEFGNVFFEPAKETFGSFICRNKTKEAPSFKFSKPWFDIDCKFARQNYRKMKRRRKQRNSDSSKRELKDAEKKYKKQMHISIRKYRRNMKTKLKKPENLES